MVDIQSYSICGNCGDIKLTETNTTCHFLGKKWQCIFLVNGNSNLIFSKWYDSGQIRYISTSICDIQFPDNYLAFQCTALWICSHYDVSPRNEAMKVRRSCLFHTQQHADFLKQFHSSLQWTKLCIIATLLSFTKINSPLDLLGTDPLYYSDTWSAFEDEDQAVSCQLFLCSFAILWVFSFQSCFSHLMDLSLIELQLDGTNDTWIEDILKCLAILDKCLVWDQWLEEGKWIQAQVKVVIFLIN